MQLSYRDGIFTIKNNNFSLLVNEEHQILNPQVINEYFNTKIPTNKYFTIEQLIRHRDTPKYIKFRDFLIECLNLIKNEGFDSKFREKSSIQDLHKPKVITKNQTFFVPLPTPNVEFFKLAEIIKKINVFIIIIFIIWIILIIIEIYNIEVRSKGVTIKR